MPTFRTPRRAALALLLTVLIGACGGGGGGHGDVSTPAGPAAPANPGGGAVPDGGGGPTESPGWVRVDHDQDAQPDTNYAAVRDDAPVVITLPTDLPEGAVIRVRGEGQGGWTLAQREGVMIRTWTSSVVQGPDGPANRLWFVRSSANGSHVVAAETSGQIYTSADGGSTWQVRPIDAAGTPRNWWWVAISADGRYIAAAENYGGLYLYDAESDTWSRQFNGETSGWWWPAWGTSADGAPVLAAAKYQGPVRIWSQAKEWSTVSGVDDWVSVSVMANGTKLVATMGNGQIKISNDRGQNWDTATGPTLSSCATVWCNAIGSADGTVIAAISPDDPIYTSVDGGLQWTPDPVRPAPPQEWRDITMSSDGKQLIAAALTEEGAGYLYASNDGGRNWTPHGPKGAWCSLASSADMTRVFAVECESHAVNVSNQVTSLGTLGSISGGAGDSIELKHLGNGMFQEVARTGNLTSQ
jgi:hypothetical protein